MQVRVAAMNVDGPAPDARRVEILACALHVLHGAQVATDAMMVSPLVRDSLRRGGVG